MRIQNSYNNNKTKEQYYCNHFKDDFLLTANQNPPIFNELELSNQ